MRPADPERQPGERQLSDAEIARELGAFLERLAAGGRFSGAVLVARDGKPFFRKAYGLASRAYGVRNRPDTKFNLGSMNKMFTSVLVGQLVQAGKLSYTEPVGRYLPDYPNKEVREKVTVYHLLTHTSGIGDYFNEKFMNASRDRFRAVRDYLPLFQEEPLQFEPGSRWAYSNAGFMLLGAIIEKVTGQSYFDYVREHLYRPAGMVNTDAYEMDADTPNLAIGYTRVETRTGEEWRNNLYLHVIKGGPAGGGFSTVEDLLRFDQALRRHEAVSAKQVEALFAGKVATPPRGHYAYGFISEEVRGGRVVGHSGGIPGLNSHHDMYLDSGYTVAGMSNYDMGAQPVINKLRRLLPTR
jgi:CubicO group peptidase (beta-lactamase class C family)